MRTLILTEGDWLLAVSGLSVIGRDYFGTFSIKGTIEGNVRDITLKKISTNTEIMNIMKILGLNFNMYGKVIDIKGKIENIE